MVFDSLFYGDMVYKLKIIAGKSNFSDHFKKIIKRYIKYAIGREGSNI